MEPPSIAEQRATAVAMLKRAASLPRMKDGRRPPMHVEAVSEGERAEKPDEDSEQDSDEKPEPDTPPAAAEVAEAAGPEAAKRVEELVEEPSEDRMDVADDKAGDVPPEDGPSERPSTPARKRRSRSRARSRGSKDLRTKPKTPPPANESSADEYAADDAPPSPPVVSPIPSPFAGFQASRFLRSPASPLNNMFYPMTSPSTPMMPSLDEIQQGLYRSNSVGAARMIAMSKLTGEPLDFAYAQQSTPLARNNTYSGEGGERVVARRNLLRRLGERVEKADPDQTSGTDDLSRPTTPGTTRRRKRRSRRSDSRASMVLDDRDEKEQASTTPNTPILPASPLPSSANLARPADSNGVPVPRRTPVQQPDVSMPMGGRGVVIEDEEEEDGDRAASGKTLGGLPATPSRRYGPRLPHTSDAPSQMSSEFGSSAVPFYLSTQPAVPRQNDFPVSASPFATPLQEKPYLDEDEEAEAYRELRSLAPSRQAFPRDSDISWVADPVPMSRIPINDEDDEDVIEDVEMTEPEVVDVPQHEQSDPGPSDTRSSQTYYPASPDTSGASKDLLIEVETSPEMSPSHVPPSPASAIALSYSIPRDTATPVQQASPHVYPRRLSVTTPVPQAEGSPLATEFHSDWEDGRPETTPKRGNDGIAGTWGRFKGTFSRSNSSSGRRSRTNSLGTRERRYNTDSSVSRESGASQTSGVKGDRSSIVAQQPPGLMQSPSASASILSLPPFNAPPGGVSPVPPASSADLLKYQDSKLFPFPGFKQLEEQRNKAKGLTSTSTPDIFSPNSIDSIPSSSSSSSATTKVPEGSRNRKLSHQVSDTRLFTKFSPTHGASSASGSSVSPIADYFNLNSPPTPSGSISSGFGSLKLPTNREGVRKWLSAKKNLFSSQSSAPSTPSVSAGTFASPGRPVATRKPSLTDLLTGRKDHELPSDWEDVSSDKSRTPVSAVSPSAAKRLEDQHPAKLPIERLEGTNDIRKAEAAQSPRVATHANGTQPTALPSPPEPPSMTPDPQSSLDDYPARSTSESLSSDISSLDSPDMYHDSARAAVVMERLEEALGRSSKLSDWPSEPPRKLIRKSPVLQVANANTVKDRFLLLFNDILVIAKPVAEQDTFLDLTKTQSHDTKLIVKSVVHLRDLKFTAERDDSRARTSLTASHTRHQVVRTFVHQFMKDPDAAISTLFSKLHSRDDPVALGQLMFRSLDLDRARLGEYLSRRTSKFVLKAFVDSFGFTGVRIDKAMRVFLLSINIPTKPALDYLLEAFASRWYDANAASVAYSKDLAVRLAGAIVQLNEAMHGGIALTPGHTGYPKRNVLSRDWVDAFRRIDKACLVSEDLLDKIYASIRRERLSQAPPIHGDMPADGMISIKRALPSRLTYRVQSDPIILRIAQPDAQLNIQLLGQDLMFDPPVLSFAKSAEASFRVIGTALGPKNIIMLRSGPNAVAYSGLPLSTPVMVERAFMRNTFQVAFQDHRGEKRKYMFSVDDHLLRHDWILSLKRQIDLASVPPPTPLAESKLQTAVEAITFKVLQDSLICSENSSRTELFPSPIDHAFARLNGRASPFGNGFLNASPSNMHRRSKSRSQVYHRHGAGKSEPEFTDDEQRTESSFQRDASLSQRPGEKVWTTADLVAVCCQNSAIPSVLAYIHVKGVDGAVS